MAESILSRVKRLVSGSVYDTVDAMERAGGTTMMRESIREVERVLDEVKSERDEITASRLHAVRLQSLYTERLKSLQEKAEYAIENGREDLAEAALIRQVEFEEQIEALQKTETEASEKEHHLEDGIASLTMRKEQMSEELKSFEIARSEVGMDSFDGAAGSKQNDLRAERAEAAFDRAISGAGGNVGLTRANMENAAKVVEIDVLQKKSLISKRLEALRSRVKAS